jgi:phosphoribosylformylglycinamidine synthase
MGIAPAQGDTLVLIGAGAGHLGQSLWLREILGREEGAPPEVDLVAERRHGDFVRAAILGGGVSACHDLSDGGLLVAIAEMVLAGSIGITLAGRLGEEAGFWFGEDQARYIVATQNPASLLREAGSAGVPTTVLGRAEGSGLTLPGGVTISAESLQEAHKKFFRDWMTA